MSKKKAVEVDPGKSQPSAGVSSRGEKHGKIPRAAGEKREKTVLNSNPDAGSRDLGKSNLHGYVYGPEGKDPRRSKPLPPPKNTSRQIEDAILADAEQHRKHLLWNGLPSTDNIDEDFNS
jgi:hypothetical protein